MYITKAIAGVLQMGMNLCINRSLLMRLKLVGYLGCQLESLQRRLLRRLLPPPMPPKIGPLPPPSIAETISLSLPPPKDLFIGVTGTTATTMEWAMTELLRNPDIMTKAKQELGETIGYGQGIEEKDIPRLPYLQALLKETMRLHPTALLLLPHCAEMDVEVCGYTIPKHTQVFVNAWAIARDPMYWDKLANTIYTRKVHGHGQ